MSDLTRYPEALLRERAEAALIEAGAVREDARATVDALLHASNTGIDSHGVRLVVHYASMLRSGRLNPTPKVSLRRTAGATAMLDADDGLAHPACYRAMAESILLAREAGIGSVGIVRSSHCGAAGAYALRAAEAGMIGIILSNSDANVALFGSRMPFHGTNPIAMAAPVPGERPWLLDMATSSIPFNRVRLYRTLGLALPIDVAANEQGVPTTDAEKAHMVLPLGGAEYGFKGAALAGLVTILSAVLTGAVQDHDMIPMTQTSDFKTRRNVGQFCLCIDPARFVGKQAFDDGIRHYIDALRGMPGSIPTERIMAPGDREWAERHIREADGIPLDPETAAFLGLLSAE